MLVLLSICRAPIGQGPAILASDWLKRIQILLLLIRHLRGLRGFKLTFSTFYPVSSLAQRNLESHKNARYDISMTAQLGPGGGERCLKNWRCSTSAIFQNLNMTYFIVNCHSSLLWHRLTFSLWHEHKWHEKGFRLLSWLPVLYLISNRKNVRSQKPLKRSSYNFHREYSDRVPI